MRSRRLLYTLGWVLGCSVALGGQTAQAGGCGCEAAPSCGPSCNVVTHYYHHLVRHHHGRHCAPPAGILVPSAPVMSAPVQMAAPVMAAPVMTAPIQMAAPVQMAPIQMAPVQMAPVQMAPVAMAPVQMAPVQPMAAPVQCQSAPQAAPAAAPSQCNGGAASAPSQDVYAKLLELLQSDRQQGSAAPRAPGDDLETRVSTLEGKVDRLEGIANDVSEILKHHEAELRGLRK